MTLSLSTAVTIFLSSSGQKLALRNLFDVALSESTFLSERDVLFEEGLQDFYMPS